MEFEECARVMGKAGSLMQCGHRSLWGVDNVGHAIAATFATRSTILELDDAALGPSPL